MANEEDAFINFLNDINKVAIKYGYNVGGHEFDEEAELIEMLFIPAIGMDAQNKKF